MSASILGDEMMTVLVSALALAAVCVPFLQGVRTALGAWSATRRVSTEELRQGKANRAGSAEPLSLLMIRVQWVVSAQMESPLKWDHFMTPQLRLLRAGFALLHAARLAK